ncbi:MAG: hydrogenase formation protein HypD, partial [Acidobacteria bacterium]|nr:hydrogenase formation protein HypD [Acidobacteriota bacterium]
MKFIDEYRQGDLASKLADQIERLTPQPLKVMEVCGGHTHTIFKYGIEDLLPRNIEMIHGPGCPVCVIPLGRVDDAIFIAQQPNVIFTTFGDAMRVPGSKTSLLDTKASGADVRMVYSPLDALKIAKKNPDKQVVFLGLGFETTAPSSAMTILQAHKERVGNFSIFCNHITIIPALKAMLDSPDLRLDGFVGPGHVSTVIGTRCYDFVPRDYGKPIVVTGFEPLDILQSVFMIVKQIVEGRAEVENQYARVVNRDGNKRALDALFEVFEPRDYFEWRGLG